MEQRQLGGLTTSKIGLGCMGFSQAYGPADDEQSIGVIRDALDHGITLIDTAMSYGQGHNEQLVGRAVAGRRDEVVLATKFGIVRGDQGVRLDGRPENVRPEDDVIPAARRLGIGLVPYSPLGRGLLTGALPEGPFPEGDFRRTDPRFSGDHLTANLELVKTLKTKAEEYGVTPGQLALAWLLAQGDDVVPIPGTRNRARLAENVAAAGVEMDPGDVVPREAWSGDRTSFAAHGTTRTTWGRTLVEFGNGEP